MTRAEHLGWSKQRALEYVDAGQLENAVASMTSDLRKHPETEGMASATTSLLGMLDIRNGPLAVRRWIESFY